MIDWTGNFIMSVAGILTSLVFGYFPIVKDWFEKLDPRWKPLVNLGVLALVTIGLVLYQCGVDWACIKLQAQPAMTAFGAAVVSNLATYQYVVKQPKRAKSLRQN